MIRKWLKFNASFVEILKNSTSSKSIDQKYFCDSLLRNYGTFPCSNNPGNLNFSGPSQPTPTGPFNAPRNLFHPLSDPKEKGDGEYLTEVEDYDFAVEETPAKTQLFEIKGPNGAAFLIEVRTKDLEEVKYELNELKGDFFRFDKTIIEWFTIKCILAAEPVNRVKDQLRLVKVHAISSGSEEVHELDGTSEFLFVNNVEKTMRAKRMLEKLGYKITGILYRFQPKQRVVLEDHLSKICHDFVEAVEKLPKVISVTHNL